MNAWSHLPNARYIDWVIKSLWENHKLWYTALDDASKEAWYPVFLEARDAADVAAWEALAAAWAAAQYAAYVAAHLEPCVAARIAAVSRGAILALITYDDCDKYLQMTYEKLKMYAILSEKPQAVLLLPMKYVKEKANECLVTLA